MAAQKGKDFLLKIGDGGGSEVFTSVGGIQNGNVTFNNGEVDVTSFDSTGSWRELLAAAGIKSMSVSGAGVFKDTTAENTVRTNAMAQTIGNWQIVSPGEGTFSGAFQISSFTRSFTHDGEVKFDLGLTSAGQVSFA